MDELDKAYWKKFVGQSIVFALFLAVLVWAKTTGKIDSDKLIFGLIGFVAIEKICVNAEIARLKKAAKIED